MTDIAALQSEILAQISGAADEAALEAVRVAALGKKGSVSALLATMGKLSPEERRIQGPLFNGLKDTVTEAIARRKAQLADIALDARLASEKLDVTLPPVPESGGTVHPISQVLEEITAIFADLGFSVAEGPDVELDDPVVVPAAASGHGDCRQRRFARPVAIGVCAEDRIKPWLQPHLHRRLRDPVGYRRNAQQPDAS